MGLTEKHKLFANEYIIDFNATRAYAKVYNREHDETSQVNGHELLRNTKIQKHIKQLLKPKLKKLDINAEYVLSGIKEIAACKDAKDNDRLKAFELLGKYLKLFTDRIELQTKSPADLLKEIVSTCTLEELKTMLKD